MRHDDHFDDATQVIVSTRSRQEPLTALPPVYHASTIFFENIDLYEEAVKSVVSGEPDRYAYGTAGTPTTAQLAHVISEVEGRSEEHTSELQSLMRISYADLCLNKKKI